MFLNTYFFNMSVSSLNSAYEPLLEQSNIYTFSTEIVSQFICHYRLLDIKNKTLNNQKYMLVQQAYIINQF